MEVIVRWAVVADSGRRHRFHGIGTPHVNPQRQNFTATERRCGFVRLGPALQKLGLLDGRAVDAPIDGQNDQRRQIEGTDGGEEDVGFLLVDIARLQFGRVQRVCCRGSRRPHGRRRLITGSCREITPLFPAQQRADTDGQRRDPNNQAKDGGPLGRHDGVVIQRPGHADVAIHGNDTERHDGGRAAEDVHRRPDVAKDGAEIPVARHLRSKRTEI